MIPALFLLAFGVFVLLIPVTFLQLLYLDSLRLRTRELAASQFFKETLEERVGLRSETGTFTFSLVKHGMLVLLGIAVTGGIVAAMGPSSQAFVEAVLSGWILMLASTYIIPHILYRRTRGEWLVPLLPVLKGLALLVRPLTAVLSFLQSLADPDKRGEQDEETAPTMEDIDALITAGAEEGLIQENDRKLIHSAVAFGDKTVREVMTPRPNIVALSHDKTLEDMRQLVIHEQYSRVPIYGGSIDQVLGFVHVRDMFELDLEQRERMTVRELLRTMRFVPETKLVTDLLHEMREDGAHMVIVVDEYGNTAGLVTMEDVVEELVGEIRDEHEPTHDVQQSPDGSYVVSGSFDVDHLRDLLNYRPQEESESTTVGGLAIEWAGRVPQPGESVEQNGIRIEVLAGNELRVEQVRIAKAVKAGHEENGQQ